MCDVQRASLLGHIQRQQSRDVGSGLGSLFEHAGSGI